ncbi:MAG: hypothetical protein ACJ78Y_05285 [Myxococcales bacterium]
MRTVLKRKRRLINLVAVAVLLCGLARAASAQDKTEPQTGQQTGKPQSPETAPAKSPISPLPAFAVIGPSRELKFAENTWFRFGAQVQGWFRIAQDRNATASDPQGTYAMDYYCRRCRFFATGSVVKDVYFNILFEAANFGRFDATQVATPPNISTKTLGVPQILDAYGQVRFADWFWLSGGSILLPLTRNGLQPTTTYLSIDTSNVAATPAAQGNTFVLRDTGFQANGFFAGNHVEYRVGVYQGTRQGATATQSGSHNGPRVVTMLSANFWDTETGYVNGGHYFGTKRVLGVMGNFDYQILRKDGPAAFPLNAAFTGAEKNAYYGASGAIFLNLPLTGASPRGADELVGLLQFGYYDGGFRGPALPPLAPATTITNAGTYPLILKQTNYLAEAAYYNHAGRFSIFGKYEMRKISDDFNAAAKTANNLTWIAGGLKYYVAPSNFMNFGLQYERIINNDAPDNQQSGTNNVTFQMQVILY